MKNTLAGLLTTMALTVRPEPPTCCGYPMVWDGQSGSSGDGACSAMDHWRCSICRRTQTTPMH